MKIAIAFLIGMLCVAFSAKAQNKSPYISRVFDFQPAPGQFTNELPEYEPGDTKADMIRKVEECIAGDEKILVSLGGYGGYVMFGFDHMVENLAGKYDFRILGNAFYADANPNSDASKEGGSCEPGIVMVSYDANENGLPDDPWYELAGSEYHKPQTIKSYRLTYYKPDENKVPTPDSSYPFLNDTTYIPWKSNQGEQGYLYRNTFHSQPYYPQWIDTDSLVFEGTKLADNYVDESGDGSYYVQYAYAWGYADNHPNTNNRSCYDISWAVDGEGNPVQLPGIHFVKVFTGVNQYCGWLGETSTEIMGAEDLHLLDEDIDVSYPESVDTCTVPEPDTPTAVEAVDAFPDAQAYYFNGALHLINLDGCTCMLIAINGGVVDNFRIHADNDVRNIKLPFGIYILRAQKQNAIKTMKIIIL